MRWQLALFIPSFFISSHSFAEPSSLAFSRNARTFETQHGSLVTKGLAHSCLTIIDIPDGLNCNPAMNSLNSKPSLGAELQLSNGYAAIGNVRKLLDGKINDELVDTLFSSGKIIQIEGGADVNFRSRYLSGQYSPFSVKGFSVVRNEANPDVELYAIEESGFTFQSGAELYDRLYAGLQFRGLKRKFIKQRTKLVALGTEAGRNLLKPKQQAVNYFEPGLTYFFDTSWRPRVSAFVVNLGFVSEKFDELDEPIEGQFGIGVSPPVRWGILDLTLEFRSMTYEESDIERLRLGLLYHFGSMYVMAGADSNGLSSGVYYGLDKVNAGIMYSTTQLSSKGESFYTQTVYAQLGWQI